MDLITAIAVLLGVLVRAVYLSAIQYKKGDGIIITSSILISILIAGEVAEEGNTFWLAVPLAAVGVLAFGYKDRILMPVGESVALFYSLLGLYLLGQFVFMQESLQVLFVSGVFTSVLLYFAILTLVLYLASKMKTDLALVFVTSFLFISLLVLIGLQILQIVLLSVSCLYLLGYALFTWVVTLTPLRLSQKMQTMMMWLFISMSVALSVVVGYDSISLSMSFFEATVIGFLYMPFLANVFYLLYFIPIPLSRSQTVSERKHEIQKHSQDLANQYYDQDIHLKEVAVVFVVFVSFVFLSMHTDLNQPLLLSAYMTLAWLIFRLEPLSAFIPHTIKQRL